MTPNGGARACRGREDGADFGPEGKMNNRARGIRVLAVMAAAIMLLLVCACGALAQDDPIRVSSRCEPQSVVTEQDVNVTIKIYNSSQTDMTEDITLFDPKGISVEKYLGGLKAEQSVTYTSTWHVTQEQIDEGRIEYFIRYYIETDEGPQQKVNTIPVTIQTASAAPQLTATYTVSPAAAKEGQQVTLSYTLSNTGNVELRDISVVNEGVSDKELTAASLSVGEKVTLTDTVTMGDEEIVSYPTVTFHSADSDKEMTIDDMARRTITVAEDGLEAEIVIEPFENVYPGEAVDVKLTMKNSGESAYTALKAAMPDGTVIAENVDLAPGASHEASVKWTPQQAGPVSAEITGLDAQGESVGVASNTVEMTLQDETTALVLRVRAQAQETTIYSEPAVVRFGIVVENIGQTDATTLTVTEAGTEVATIPSLPSGESRTVVIDVQTSIAGQIQFEVSGKDAIGNERSYASNVIQLVYLAPTPTPTAAPTPTPVPPTPSPAPTATPEPTLSEIISEHVDLRVLYAVAGVLGAVLVLIVVTSTVSAVRRKKRMAGALDTIELTPDIRNHRGTKKKRSGKKEKADKTEKKAKSQFAEMDDLPEQIVPTPELTEEDTLLKKDAPKAESAQPREENRRRRPMAEVEVPTDETLRVAPVGERPDFIAQGRVDDSQTRVFTRLKPEEGITPETHEEPRTRGQFDDKPNVETKRPGGSVDAQFKPDQDDELDRTIRLDRAQIEQITSAPERRDVYEKGGKKREDIKPMKKKFSLFGKKKKEDEFDEDEMSGSLNDDFDEDFDDDDFFE